MPTEIAPKVMDVFLASPGDLREERKIIKDVIDLANEIVRDQGLHIELYGWEDTLPGFCRPQDLINEDVDRCSLFIGMLWKRWGQPTGQFSSGFEEEFDRVRKRKYETGLPEIWIFFKKIDPSSLADPGKQLERVMLFREDQERKKEMLFREFENPSDLKDNILKYLIKYAFKNTQKALAILNETSLAPEGSLQQAPELSEVKTVDSNNKESIPRQLTELMELATDAICSGNFSLSLHSDALEDHFNSIRFYLIASALVFQRYTNDLLGTQEINILYLYREKLEMVSLERVLILRSVIGSPFSINPGWYWFKDVELDRINFSLYHLAMWDKDVKVRMGAFDLLKDARIRPKKEWANELDPIKLLFEEKDIILKPLVYSYLAEIGICDDLALFDQALMTEDRSAYQNLLLAKISIISRIDPNKALNLILSLSSDLISNNMVSILEREASRLESSLLLRALDHYKSSVRLLIIGELDKRGELTQELAFSLLKSSNKDMKNYLYKYLITHGWKGDIVLIKKELEGSLDAKEEILFSIYNMYTDEELEDNLDWYSSDGFLVYRVLGLRHYESMKTRIIEDLDNEFQDFHHTYRERNKQKFGDQNEEVLKGFDDSVSDYIRNRFTISALSIILERGNPENGRIARKYINNDDPEIKKLALQIISKHGDPSDVSKLIEICLNSYGEIKELAANSALKLKPGMTGAPSSFLLTNDNYLIKLALKSLEEEPIEQTKSFIEDLLRNNNDFIRTQAVSFLINKLTKEELESLMKNYQKNEYYYNVMSWLDRILYAPSTFKEVFRKKLENESS